MAARLILEYNLSVLFLCLAVLNVYSLAPRQMTCNKLKVYKRQAARPSLCHVSDGEINHHRLDVYLHNFVNNFTKLCYVYQCCKQSQANQCRQTMSRDLKNALGFASGVIKTYGKNHSRPKCSNLKRGKAPWNQKKQFGCSLLDEGYINTSEAKTYLCDMYRSAHVLDSAMCN